VTDVAIRTRALTKVYRLYTKPAYRFLDIFGMLGDRPGAFTEHAALDGINLEIKRGEKVAIIGRNGAGKSTFLKLVTNVIQPTTGALEVKGDVHALLQIGTGFHPDFTGRENVHAYLAQLGVAGQDAERRCADAIEFAELEEYIDQPVKTYSTGMAMRLMFSASTAIAPDLLVLDEVLGVGDAYFARKSYDRMRELCDRNGATLLLVTHDIYSATRMCNRVVWFDRGMIAMDGDAATVVKAYEESIRAQEERRLRLKMQARIAAAPHGDRADDDVARVMIEIQGAEGRAQPSPVYFSAIALVASDRVVAELPLGDDAFDATRGSHLVREGASWGDAGEWRGRPARPMLNYGSPFHKVVGVVALPRRQLTAGTDLKIVLECASEEPCRLRLRCYIGGHADDLGELSTTPGEWMTHSAPYRPTPGEGHRPPFVTPAPGVQGAADIVITDFAMLDEAGDRVHTVRHGDTASFVLAFRIVKALLRERAQVFLVVSRNNTERVCKFMTDQLIFDQTTTPEGVVEMRVRKMPLGRGTYSVAVEIAAEGYIEKRSNRFFSVDPDVYYCITHALDFTVTDSGWMGDGTIFEGDAEWSMKPVASETRV
jgi:ABC-type polysaccharide/polyol phosphate transport system ATPase subunit